MKKNELPPSLIVLQFTENPFNLDIIFFDDIFFVAVDKLRAHEDKRFYFKIESNFHDTAKNLTKLMTTQGIFNKILPSRFNEILIEIQCEEHTEVLSAPTNSFIYYAKS